MIGGDLDPPFSFFFPLIPEAIVLINNELNTIVLKSQNGQSPGCLPAQTLPISTLLDSQEWHTTLLSVEVLAFFILAVYHFKL